MARPTALKSKIFLDSGDPAETKAILDTLGFLDGQTTNPTLVAKNPYARERFENGQKFSEKEIYDFYRQVVQDISALIPQGSVSIEVYADADTTAEAMFAQGKEMFSWIANAHVKYPTIPAGLAAAEQSIAAGHRVNMTLCFTEEQAAAIYAATRGAQPGDVFVSPFIGRLDDLGQNGMDLIANICQLFANSDHHVQVLAASVRTLPHLMQSLAVGADCITAPYTVLAEWASAGMPLPDEAFRYDAKGLEPIVAITPELSKNWQDYTVQHELTAKGVERFAQDWNQLLS